MPCNYSMNYYSVIGFGKAYLIENFDDKKEALNIIMKHYLNRKNFEYKERLFIRLTIFKVEIDMLTGKKSGY